ncbi:MAG: bifunctional adenosylcobinamide kinase/adenosylcobinamide-phosphate guanylyltransferase [Deltaproteobacteria bacterium]|nr:bifunctional adenosylcobinamide kinase/adenosylcobinamide-phosphate guanylyltransferase [Deltaproteobacteria bacterium]
MMFKKKFEKGCMLVIGGARSGKSAFALDVCHRLKGKRVFLATAEALDEEMKKRIDRHRTERGAEWLSVEEPLNVAGAIEEKDGQDRIILLDCLTLWLNNLYMRYGGKEEIIEREVERLLKTLSHVAGAVVAVSNETGMGIVPKDPLSRSYRDTLGSLNRRVGEVSKKVVALMAGLPLALKDE